MESDNTELLTAQEAGQIFGIGAWGVRKRIRTGALEGCRIAGGQWRIPKSAIRAHLLHQIETATRQMQKAA